MSHRLLCLSLLITTWLLGGCHPRRGTTAEETVNPSAGVRVISDVAIEKTGARTAWEALQRTVPFYTFNDNNRGGTSGIEHRGRSSIYLRDVPLILMDGVELNDYTTLTSTPASDIREIEVLTGIDATTYYGTNASKGVIRIWTKGG